MKKIRNIIILIFVLQMSVLITVSNAVFTAQINIEENSTISINDEVILKVTTNENVVALNFKVNYDEQAFDLIGSETQGLSVSKQNGKIACIYFDMSGTGTKEFKIKLKAKETTTNAQFSIENAKLRVQGQNESYTENEVTGLQQQVNLVVESKIVTSYNSDIIQGQDIVTIMFKNTYTDRNITKDKFMEYTPNVGTLKNANGANKSDTDVIATGDKIQINNQEYTVVLYGDANGDGIVCDSDDIMVIINDYLGKREANGIHRVAANLENTDNLLDTDDLVRMINRYLGNTTKELLKNII